MVSCQVVVAICLTIDTFWSFVLTEGACVTKKLLWNLGKNLYSVSPSCVDVRAPVTGLGTCLHIVWTLCLPSKGLMSLISFLNVCLYKYSIGWQSVWKTMRWLLFTSVVSMKIFHRLSVLFRYRLVHDLDLFVLLHPHNSWWNNPRSLLTELDTCEVEIFCRPYSSLTSE